MRRRFKIAFVILLVATIVWTFAWYQLIIDYNQTIKWSEERFQEWLEERKESGLREEGLRQPIWGYKYGWVVLVSGFIICIAWEFLLAGVYKDWRKGKDAKNEKVSWVVEILVILVSIVIFILYPIALFAPLIFSMA